MSAVSVFWISGKCDEQSFLEVRLAEGFEEDELLVETLACGSQAWICGQDRSIEVVQPDREQNGVVAELGERHLVLAA